MKKEKFKNIKQKIIRYLPLICLVIYAIYLQFNMNLSIGDDLYFSNLQNENLLNLLVSRYNEWTSRFLIEGIMIGILSYVPILWRIITFSSFIIIYFVLENYFNDKKNLFISWTIAICIILIPFSLMSSAGWGATTMNYWWPLTAVLIAFLPIVNLLKNKTYNKWNLIFQIPLLIYACNQEQVALLSCGFLIVFIIYYFINKKKIPKMFWIYLLISLISLIFILVCPGNNARYITELERWFPDFTTLNIFEKSLLSLNNTFELIIGQCSYLYILLFIFVGYLNYKNKNKLNVFLCVILLIGLYLIPKFPVYYLNSTYALYFEMNNNLLPLINLESKWYILSILVSFVYLLSTLFLLFKLPSKKEEKHYINYLYCIIFMAGFLSRFVIGFSPTIFASNLRTGIFFEIAILFLLVLLSKKISDKNTQHIFYAVLVILILLAKLITINISIRM